MPYRRRLQKYVIFLAGWLTSVFILAMFSINNDLNLITERSHLSPLSDSPSNRIGAFKFVQYSSERGSDPLFSVSFDNIFIENNNLGMFKSALYQAAHISNLEFKIYHYPENTTKSCNLTKSGPLDFMKKYSDNFLSAQPSKNGIIAPAKNRIESILNMHDDWHTNLDIAHANISDLIISDFSYVFFSEKNLVLSIKSKRAIASYNSKGLELRGHVIINNHQQKSVLESNHVVWDIASNIFIVQGVYVLNQNNVVKVGKDVTLNYALNKIVPNQAVKSFQKEIKCARLL
jgi:hypothetical protein